MKNDEYFMEIALNQAKSALSAGEFPVGCVMIYDGDVLVSGSRTGTKGLDVNEIDHAEIIALKQLSSQNKMVDKGQIALYSTLEPCLMCYGAILLSGIGKIVYAYEDVMGGGTKCNLADLTPLYQEKQIPVIPNILRRQSVELFREYFKNNDNNYWKESLLARYTLAQ